MARKRAFIIPGVDTKLLVKDATKLQCLTSTRRRFLTGGASLGALTLLAGCDVVDEFLRREPCCRRSRSSTTRCSRRSSIRTRWRPTFPESAITKPFPFNAYYDLDDAPEIEAKDWELEVRGLVDNKKSWKLDELYALPQEKQVTRHICVEGWSAIGSWTGTPLARFPQAHRRRHEGEVCLVPLRREATLRRSTWRPRCIRRPR